MRTALLFATIMLGFASYAQEKRIYISCDDHTDYMWSADEETYHQAFTRMLDYYMDLADRRQSNPSDSQSRFVCDGSYWIWVYERENTPDEFERLIAHLKSGHIAAPMTALTCCYGGMPAEAVIRSMYYAGQLERRYGLRFPLALSIENQTMPWGLASLWAGSGARYSWKGICGCATRIPDAWDREHDIYYWTGPDGQKILVKWNSMLRDNQSMGGYAEARDPWAVVDYVTSDKQFQSRYPYPVIGCFGKGWDDLETRNNEFVLASKHLTDKNRRVIVSNAIDFFEDFEQSFANSLPTVNYSYGNEWDLLCASMAEVSASVKRSVERLRTAEALATLATLYDPHCMDGRDELRDQAFMNVGLFYEHSWTGDGRVPRDQRAAWQRRIAESISAYPDKLYSDASAVLGSMIPRHSSNPRFYVFNPLGWARTDYADLPCSSTEALYVLDLTTGTEAPSQCITINNEPRLRILAQHIPAVGYKVFEVRSGRGNRFPNAAVVKDNILENHFYRIAVSPGGAITSLIDKQRSDREFARLVDGTWINDIGPSTGTLQLDNAGPVSVTMKSLATSPLRHTSSITLYRHCDRIDITNEITENFRDTYTYAFSFNLNSPDVHHEEVGAIARAKYNKDGGDYATQSARYDWLTFNHFADMTGAENLGVTISNADSYYFRLGSSEVKTLDTSTPIIYALIGGQVDGEDLGIRRQGGDQYFLHRYSLRTHGKYDQTAAMRFSLEHQNPLLCGRVFGTESRLPEAQFSAIQISNPNVFLWTIKPADEGVGRGIIIRLWNVANSSQSTNIQLASFPVENAWVVSHLETDIAPQKVGSEGLSVRFKKQEIRTFRLTPKRPTTNE